MTSQRKFIKLKLVTYPTNRGAKQQTFKTVKFNGPRSSAQLRIIPPAVIATVEKNVKQRQSSAVLKIVTTSAGRSRGKGLLVKQVDIEDEARHMEIAKVIIEVTYKAYISLVYSKLSIVLVQKRPPVKHKVPMNNIINELCVLNYYFDLFTNASSPAFQNSSFSRLV